MRSLIISAVSLLLVLAIWFGFMTYSEKTLNYLIEDAAATVELSVKNENWDAAEEEFQQLSTLWHRDKAIYSFFLDQSAMLDTDFAIARAKALIEAKDKASSLGELSVIREQLRFLFLNERINLENIF